jgi:hypothetical protein
MFDPCEKRLLYLNFLVEARRRSVAGGVIPGTPEQPAKGVEG